MIWVGMCFLFWFVFVYVIWVMNIYEFNFFLVVLLDCIGIMKESNIGR